MATLSKMNGALLLLKCLVALCMLDSVDAFHRLSPAAALRS